MLVVPAGRHGLAERLVAPATALLLVALQVASNATREALFLSSFHVTSLPWVVGLAALVTFPAAHGAGRLQARLGPRVTVPAFCGLSCVLFAGEAALLRAQPAVVAIVIYLHAAVLGAIVVSAFWSLLDERFDAYAAKPLFARVAGAATLGSILGGVGAERLAAASGSPLALLTALAAGTALCLAGALVVGRGVERAAGGGPRAAPGGATRPEVPYLRALAVVALVAALAGTLCDYLLKADAAAHVAASAPLIRFFGLFYAATGLAAFLAQAAFAPGALNRLGIAGTLAVHPIALATAGLVALVVPSPWRGILPRCADATIRHSLFRTGYELLFTPLPDTSRRSAKTTIDVGWHCVGDGLGAAVVFLLTRLVPARDLVAITVVAVLVAGVDLWAAWQLRSGYVRQLEGSLRGAALPRVTHQSFTRMTVTLDRGTAHVAHGSSALQDPVAEALAALRSGDPDRIRRALPVVEHEPLLVGAAIRLLDRAELLEDVARAVGSHGARVTGQLVDALTDAATPEVVRRRLPLLLKACRTKRARDGLIEGLSDASVTVRHRCGKALLELTAREATLAVPADVARGLAERELEAGAGDERSIAHVFDLLSLAYDRDAMALARRTHQAGTAGGRGTALAYLEATLPRPLFTKLARRLSEQATLQSTS